MEYIKFNNGVEIPQVGLGVFLTPDGKETVDSVRWALEAGYRQIDTAMVYGNEESVREGIAQSGVPREEIFITTKMWNSDIYHGNFDAALETSLEKLGTDYIDLYLLHWPVKGRVEAWKALERFYEQGKCRASGVSNFEPHHL
ncbi:MAG: aldo/keto reductase, partial [Atopobiaceae bacterium]|nr:aldo/keto reductase [Atopobiaceae bacterium]